MALTYHLFPLSIGEAIAMYSPDGLIALRVAGSVPARELLPAMIAEAGEHVVPGDPARGQDLETQLDAYLNGRLREFDITLDWRLTQGFRRRALEAMREVPYGSTASYGEVAELAGHPRAARAVGAACRTSPFSLVVPVHRIVRADGTIGGYGGEEQLKRFLLDLEKGQGSGVAP